MVRENVRNSVRYTAAGTNDSSANNRQHVRGVNAIKSGELYLLCRTRTIGTLEI